MWICEIAWLALFIAFAPAPSASTAHIAIASVRGRGVSPEPSADAAHAAYPVEAVLTRAMKANLQANHFLFTDATDGWTASPSLYHYSFAADTTITMMSDPEFFSPFQILNIAEKFIAARNSAGEFPMCLQKTGVAEAYYSAWDLLHHHATGDAAFYVPQLEYLYYQQTKSTAAFRKDAPAMKQALSLIPINPATGMVHVAADDAWVPWGFEEMARKTGDDLMGSLLYVDAVMKMTALSNAIGDTASAATFRARSEKVRASLFEFSDPQTGMLVAATGQDRQIDVQGSAYAVYLGITTPLQTRQISAYIARHFDHLTLSGYVRQTPRDWAVCNYIHGGPCAYGPGQYDNGAWSVADGWVAEALARTSPALAARLITDFARSSDPTQEYWALPGAAEPRKGQTLNLESPAGALQFVRGHPSLFREAASHRDPSH